MTTAKPETPASDKTYWLIERGSPCEWLETYRHGVDYWTTDASKAMRGPKLHLESLIQKWALEGARVTGHMDCETTPEAELDQRKPALTVPSELLLLLADPLMGPAITRFVADVRRGALPASPSAQPKQGSIAPRVFMRLVQRYKRQRDECADALRALLAHCDVTSDGETDFERAVIVGRAAVAEVPTAEQQLENIFNACRDEVLSPRAEEAARSGVEGWQQPVSKIVDRLLDDATHELYEGLEHYRNGNWSTGTLLEMIVRLAAAPEAMRDTGSGE